MTLLPTHGEAPYQAPSHAPSKLPRPLILGSSSPYRKELLERLRVPFRVEAPDIDESPRSGEACDALALRLACSKASAIAARFPEAVVIGSDQVADLDGEPLGKPGTHDRAVAQLQRMRGKTVIFQTAVAVACQATGFQASELASVKVRFRALTDEEIENYLLAETPYDCAGSAKSEGLGITLLASIENDDPTALIGLPLIRTSRLIAAAGIDLLVKKAQA
jgi:septum formation protein